MGAEEANTRSAVAPLRRPTWTSNRSSVRSSTSSTLSGLSYDTANSSTIDAEVGEDKVLYTNGERKHPLRPLKSIRRPSKLTLNKEEPAWSGASGSTSPKDKRKALYVTPGDVPSISSRWPSFHRPMRCEQFAGALGRNISRNRGRGSESSETAPELVVSGSPSSGYESSGASTDRAWRHCRSLGASWISVGRRGRREDLWRGPGWVCRLSWIVLIGRRLTHARFLRSSVSSNCAQSAVVSVYFTRNIPSFRCESHQSLRP